MRERANDDVKCINEKGICEVCGHDITKGERLLSVDSILELSERERAKRVMDAYMRDEWIFDADHLTEQFAEVRAAVYRVLDFYVDRNG